MQYGSVCSGIEAASVAWHPLGWRAAWLAEIEKFPAAVLAHHYPDTKNLGDMTKIAKQVMTFAVAAPDVLVGGTPCQAFSVAGMRQGLDDPRGALTIKYVELADAIDHVRSRTGLPACITVWENVPGVLSDRGNAFGCFLGALAGEDCELQPSGGKWSDAGCVYGPKRAIAWRVLDAQYFGLAQRRRRVFVVASARAGFDPCEVLFEREGVRRDHPPRRGEGQDVAGHAPFGPALQCGCGHVFELSTGPYGCPDCEGDFGPAVEVLAGVPAFGGENQAGSLFQAPALTAHGVRNDFASETFCIHGTQDPDIRIDQAHTLGRNSGQENAIFAIQAGALRTNPLSGPDGVGVQAEHAYTLEARAEVQAICVTGDIAHTLKAEGFDASEEGTGRGQPIISVALRGREGGATAELGDDVAGTLRACSGGGDKPHALVASAVRRLTPTECERLQGFPDDYTLVPYRNKEAADGPRYKAIGNSMAVPCMRWIGMRINDHLEQHT